MKIFADLSWAEIEQFPKAKAVCLIPVAALEDLGPHLPVGLRVEESKALTALIGSKLEAEFDCLILPQLPFAIDSVASTFGSYVGAHVMRDAIRDFIAVLEKLGFTRFVVVTTSLGPKTLTAIDELIHAKKKFLRKQKSFVLSIAPAWVGVDKAMQSPLFHIPLEQGGVNDTSICLCLLPNQVRPNWKDLEPKSAPVPSFSTTTQYLKKQIGGYWGYPALATPEQGARVLDELVNQALPHLTEALRSKKNSSVFRTSFRWFPFNRSYFKVYILAFVFTVMMLIWVLWSVREYYAF